MNQKMEKIDYLCIGHACHDVKNEDYILGGTASYSSVAAANLGKKAASWISCGDDFLFDTTFSKHNVVLFKQKSSHTTIFDNRYINGRREQYLLNRADVMNIEAIPNLVAPIAIVHICPIADEIDYNITTHFPNSFIGLTPQGSLRAWAGDGKIYPKTMDWTIFNQVDAVILSEEDLIGYEDNMPNMIQNAKLLVITNGDKGAYVYSQNQKKYFPAYPIKEYDATGAGDVFATAFFIKYAETRDITEGVIFAHAAASFVVEGLGLDNLGALNRIYERCNAYKTRFKM